MSLEVPRIFWPLVIDSTNNGIGFLSTTSGNAPSADEYLGTVASGTYDTPETFCTAIAAAIQAAVRTGPISWGADGGTSTVTISTSGVMTVSLGSLVVGSSTSTFHWNTLGAAYDALAALMGFDNTADDSVTNATGTHSFTADYQMQHFWTPGYPVETDTGSGAVDFDTSYIATVSTNAAGQQVSTLWSGTPVYERTVTIGLLPKEKIWTLAESTSVNQALERLLVGGYGKFRYWPDRATLGTYADYFLREQAFADFKGIASTRFSSAVERYRITLAMGRYVS